MNQNSILESFGSMTLLQIKILASKSHKQIKILASKSHKQIKVFLTNSGYKGVYALGDCASITDPHTGKPMSNVNRRYSDHDLFSILLPGLLRGGSNRFIRQKS